MKNIALGTVLAFAADRASGISGKNWWRISINKRGAAQHSPTPRLSLKAQLILILILTLVVVILIFQ